MSVCRETGPEVCYLIVIIKPSRQFLNSIKIFLEKTVKKCHVSLAVLSPDRNAKVFLFRFQSRLVVRNKEECVRLLTPAVTTTTTTREEEVEEVS